MQEKSKFTQSGFNDIVIRKLNLEAREREREREREYYVQDIVL